MDRLDEALEICRLMFTEGAPSFKGRYYEISEAHNMPGPVRPDGIPIMVGGGGEKRTLRAAARFADAVNIFGDAETVRHKMKVLDEHCAAVGRDPREICRTALKTLIIDRNANDAAEKAKPVRDLRGGDRFRIIGMAGTPDEVGAQARELREAGLDGLIVNLPDAYDLETVALAGETLSRL